MNGIGGFLSSVAHLDAIAREAIRDNWDEENGYGAKPYAEHHAEELGLNELNSLDTFLSRIRVSHLAFDPDDEDRHVVLDYTVDRRLTQYVLAVVFNRSGEINEVVMES